MELITTSDGVSGGKTDGQSRARNHIRGRDSEPDGRETDVDLEHQGMDSEGSRIGRSRGGQHSETKEKHDGWRKRARRGTGTAKTGKGE